MEEFWLTSNIYQHNQDPFATSRGVAVYTFKSYCSSRYIAVPIPNPVEYVPAMQRLQNHAPVNSESLKIRCMSHASSVGCTCFCLTPIIELIASCGGFKGELFTFAR